MKSKSNLKALIGRIFGRKKKRDKQTAGSKYAVLERESQRITKRGKHYESELERGEEGDGQLDGLDPDEEGDPEFGQPDSEDR